MEFHVVVGMTAEGARLFRPIFFGHVIIVGIGRHNEIAGVVGVIGVFLQSDFVVVKSSTSVTATSSFSLVLLSPEELISSFIDLKNLDFIGFQSRCCWRIFLKFSRTVLVLLGTLFFEEIMSHLKSCCCYLFHKPQYRSDLGLPTSSSASYMPNKDSTQRLPERQIPSNHSHHHLGA